MPFLSDSKSAVSLKWIMRRRNTLPAEIRSERPLVVSDIAWQMKQKIVERYPFLGERIRRRHRPKKTPSPDDGC